MQSPTVRKRHRISGPSWSVLPVLNLQPKDPAKLTNIPSDDRGAKALGLCGDQCVHWANPEATSLEVVANRRVVRAIVSGERLNRERLGQFGEHDARVRVGSFGDAKLTLGKDDHRQAQLTKCVLHFLNKLWVVSAHVGRDGVGVRQIDHSILGMSGVVCGGTSSSSGQEPARAKKRRRRASKSALTGSSKTPPDGVRETAASVPGRRNSRGSLAA